MRRRFLVLQRRVRAWMNSIQTWPLITARHVTPLVSGVLQIKSTTALPAKATLRYSQTTPVPAMPNSGQTALRQIALLVMGSAAPVKKTSLALVTPALQMLRKLQLTLPHRITARVTKSISTGLLRKVVYPVMTHV
jgi:hypothetical protein